MHTVVDDRSIGFVTGLLAERVRRELNVAFAKDFSLWGDGRPLSADAPAHGDGGRCQPTDRLSRTLRQSGPHVVDADGDSRMLAVPITQNGAVAAVAVAAFEDVESPRQLIQTAQLVLDKVHAQDEIERLRQQNEEHLVQVTQDLEELTFLRSIAAHLEVTDANNDLWSLARKILPSLRHSIRAENVVLIAAPLASDSQAAPTQRLIQVGVRRLPESSCFHLIEKFRPQTIAGTLVRNRLRMAEPAGASIRNVIVTPLTKSGAPLAWLMAVNRTDVDESGGPTRWALSQNEFGTNEASLVESAASILATHAVNVQLVRDKERLVASVVRTLVTTIEAKDEYTRGHSERVALFAQCLGREMGLSVEACDELYLTGLVHDVGKIGVCDAILKKVTALTAAEFEEIKKHPDEGWAILRDLEQLAYVLPGVLHHHERYDGRGYPDGLRGDDIPIEGRILAVADAYDAMTSDRAYRKGRSHAEAKAVLCDGSSTQWDPQVVDAFVNVEEQIAFLCRSYRTEPKPRRQRTAAQPQA